MRTQSTTDNRQLAHEGILSIIAVSRGAKAATAVAAESDLAPQPLPTATVAPTAPSNLKKCRIIFMCHSAPHKC